MEPMEKKRILAISNRKGGSGKTTTVVNVGAALAQRGYKVLIVDTDPQAHTSLSFGITPKNISSDLYSILVERKKPEEVMVGTYLDKLMIIPATRRLSTYEKNYSKLEEARTCLAERISTINEYFDFIILDTPPTMSLLNVAALIASNEVFVPMQTHFLSLEGLAEMVTLISKINKLYNPNVKINGVIPTFYKERTRLSRAIFIEIKKTLGDSIILHPIRENISLAEAPGYGKTIFQYNLKSNGAYDYLAVAKQIEGLK